MKTVKRGILALALTLTLCLGVLPLPVSAADLYFTALNERVELLTSDSMPFWYGGTLYVPYSVFDKDLNTTQIFLGLNVSYNSRTRSTVTIYNLRQQMLTFDLNSGTCMDELTGETYDARAIMRNGKPYLPVATVCAYFGLNWSYTALSSIPDGYLVRITNSDVVLDDATFIDAAGNTLDARLQQYTQSLNSAASTTPAPTPTPAQPVEPQPEEPISPNDIPTYLAVLGREGDGLRETLDALDSAGRYALFFLTPQVLEEEGDLVRRMLGSGHLVGILAQGEDPDQTRALLERGTAALEAQAHTRTTLAYVPEGQQSALEGEGWVCWDETLLLSPDGSVSPSTFAARTLSRLEGRELTTYLTLEGGEDAARVLPTLLRRLTSDHFILGVPIETRL